MIKKVNKNIIDSPESIQFGKLFTLENLKKFKAYKKMTLSPELTTNEYNYNIGQTENMLDFNYWNGSAKKNWPARSVRELEEFFATLPEIALNAEGQYVLASTLNESEEEPVEEEVEEEVEETPIVEIDPEDITPTKKVEGEGIEYIGCNEVFRLYHITSVEGARKFALPRGEGMGWCVTGGGSWSKGPISNSNQDFINKSKKYWNMEKNYDLYFFMTEPMGESWALGLKLAQNSTGRTCWWRARTDTSDSQSLYGKLVPRTIPLYLLENELGTEKIEHFYATADENVQVSLPQTAVEFACSGERLNKCNIINMSTIIVPANTVEGGTTRLTTIGGKAFKSNNVLTTVNFTNNVTTLNDSAFENQTNLTTVDYLSQDGAITKIGKRAFFNCQNLKTVPPLNVSSIMEETFKNCTNLQRVNLSSNLTSIGDNAFENCKMLTYLNIPASCESIGMHAFKGCNALTIKVAIPKSQMPSGWYKQILTDVKIKWADEPLEETEEEVTTDSVSVEDYDPYEWFEKHTIDQSLFVRLVKYDEEDVALTGQKYAIFNDFNLVKTIEASNDEEAVKAFEKWLENGGTKVNKGMHDSKTIQDEEMIVDTDEEQTEENVESENEEDIPTEEEAESREIIAKFAAKPALEKYKNRISNSKTPEHEYEEILTEIENLNLDPDIQNELEDELWDYINDLVY